MGKKIKPNKLFDDNPVDSTNDATQTAADPNSEIASRLDVDANPLVGSNRMTTEDLEKLQKYDAMEKSLSDVTSKNEMLEAKIDEYINRLNDLSSSSDTITNLQNENATLKESCKKLESLNNKFGSELKTLKDEVEKLRNENDQYLMKISELTFDNANLQSHLSELDNAMKRKNVSQNSNRYTPTTGIQPQMINGLGKPMVDPYNPYINNGYGTW